jgi:large conductance mechanosensitive channel
MFNEFKKFILRGNVVDLAVGIAIGAAFTSFVNALVKDLVNPIVNIFYKGETFANAHITIRGSEILYGDLINAFISFVIVAAVIFFFVVKPINSLSEFAFKSKETGEPTSKKCPHCLGKIPKEATKCMYCTSNLTVKG